MTSKVLDMIDPFTSKATIKSKRQKRSQGSSHYRTKNAPELQALPHLKDTSPAEQQDLFIKKLQQCCLVFDFMDPVSDLKSKEIKRACLNELVDYITATRGVLTEPVYSEIVGMILKSMWCLFHDSSARREFYIRLNTSKDFPLSFCSTRWTENEDVTARALKVWDNVVKVIQHYTMLSQSLQPQKNSSYETLIRIKHDILMKVKFQAFRDIASMLSIFLKLFQTDAPMVPFLSDVLEQLMRHIMRLFVRNGVLENAATAYKLIKIDISSPSNLLPIDQVKFTAGAKALLKSITCSPAQKTRFQKEYAIFLSTMVQKLQERSPIKSLVVRCSSSLSPYNMVQERDVSFFQFEILADKLHEHGRLSSQRCDDAKIQYEKFVDTVVKENRDLFRQFDMTTSCVDQFLSTYLVGEKKFESFWHICIFVFTLSHGQSQIERGFNINKDMLVVNLEQTSLKGQRMIYDHMISTDTKIQHLNITKELVLNCKGAHAKYVASLTEKKNVCVETLHEKKKKIIAR